MNTQPGVAPQSLTEQVATEIRVQLARQGIRQSDLARKLGRNDQWLSVRIRGTQPIDLSDLEEIAAGLGVAVADLLPESVQLVTDQEVIKSRPLRTRPTRHAKSGVKPTARYSPRPDRPSDGRPKGRAEKQAPPSNVRRPVWIGSTGVKPSGPRVAAEGSTRGREVDVTVRHAPATALLAASGGSPE